MKTCFIVGVLFIFSCGIIFLACDSYSPVYTSDLTSQAFGTWLFSGQIVNNNCQFLFNGSGYRIGTPKTETLNILYSNTWLASHVGGDIYRSGIILRGYEHETKKFLRFRVENPQSLQHGQCPYWFQGEADIFLNSETTGTGSVTVEVLARHNACPSCSILHTGIWTKLSNNTVPITRLTPTPVIIYTPTPVPVSTTIPIATPTGTPVPTITSVPVLPPLPGTLLISAAPGTITDTTSPDSTSMLTICALSSGGVPQSGVRISLQITNGSGLLSSGTLFNTVVTNVAGCAYDVFTEQGIGWTTILATAAVYQQKTVRILVVP